MTERINVTLAVQADIEAARKKMYELNNALSKVLNSGVNQNFMSVPNQKLSEATIAAGQLQAQLQNAFNVDTGKLNLTKFNQELAKSGHSLEYYKQQLLAIGPQGSRAFAQVAEAIATADTRVKSSIALVDKMKKSLVNVGQYLISTNLLRGLTSSVTEAVKFVEELNGSLNDIRIVTGYSADKMEDFTVSANKAAKALKTTTKAYADASLIYFQQGLSDSEVQERTNATIKMANVTGQSVENVSNQLTAIWNNFDNGTKSLEYYADVITALGAATASSSDEIAQGLEKFAAVAETVGLSYEYATAALATVTAETRQSADVVGTAFKTLFARIQDLELGDTLEDGVTLGKYSQALSAIGIEILDATGNVKDMNTILDEMGNKWGTLTEAQKVSTAQTVAGVRQYTQLISLMENWDKVQQNVSVASGSEGELTNQAKIYAESWEAAKKSVQASAEEIYQSLLDDKFFIKILNGFSDFLDNLNDIIEALGGMKGLLLILGTILMRTFGPQLLTNFSAGLATVIPLLGKAQERRNETRRDEALGELSKMSAQQRGLPGQQSLGAAQAGDKAKLAYNDLIKKKNLSAEDEDRFKIYFESYAKALEKVVQAEEALAESTKQLANERKKAVNEVGYDFTQEDSYKDMVNRRQNTYTVANQFGRITEKIIPENLDKTVTNAKNIVSGLKTESGDWDQSVQDIENTSMGKGFMQALNELETALDDTTLDADKLQKILSKVNALASEGANQAQDELFDKYADENFIGKENSHDLTNQFNAFRQNEEYSGATIDTIQNEKAQTENEIAYLEQEKTRVESKYQSDLNEKEQAQDAYDIAEQKRRWQAKPTSGKQNEKDYREINNKLIKNRDEAKQIYEQKSSQVSNTEKELLSIEQKLTTLKEKKSNQEKEILEYQKKQNEYSQQANKFQKDNNILTEEERKKREQIKNQADAEVGFKGEQENVESAANAAKTQAEVIEEESSRVKAQLMGTAQAISTLSSSLMMGVSAFTTMTNAIKVLGDENASTSEKITTALTAAGMAMSAFGMIINENTIKALASVSASVMQALGYKGAGVAAVEAAGATGTLTTATASFGATLWAVLWPIGLVLAAIAAVIAIVYGLTKAFESEESKAKKALEQTQKNIEQLETSIQNAKDANEQFIASYDKYDQAVKNLKTLEDGTDEYKKAIIEANEQARQLIETYGLWDKYTIQNGIITFNEGTYDDIIKQQEESIYKKQAVKLLQQTQAFKQEYDLYLIQSEKKIQKIINNSRNNIVNNSEMEEISKAKGWDGTIEVEQWNDNLQAFSQELKNIDLTLLSQALNLARESKVDAETTKWILEKYDINLTEEAFSGLLQTFKEGRLVFSEVEDTFDKMQLKIKKQNEQISQDFIEQQLQGKIGAEENTELYNAALSASNALFQGITANIEGYSNDITYSEAINEAQDNISKNINERKDLNKHYNLGLDNEIDLGKKYAELYNMQENIRVSTDEKGNVVITDTSGTELETMSEEAMAEAIAVALEQSKIKEAFEGSMDANIVNTIIKESPNELIAQTALNAISNNGQFDFTSLIGQMGWSGENGFSSFKELSGEQMAKYLGLSSDTVESIAKLLEINSEDFYNNIKLAAEKWTEKTVYDSILSSGASELEISEDALVAYTQSLQKNNEALKKDEIAATQAAIASLKYSKNVEETEDALKKVRDAEEGSLEYYQAFGEFTKNLEDQVGIDLSTFDNYETILEKVGEAAADSSVSLDSLRETLGKLILEDLFDLETDKGKNAYQEILKTFVDLNADLKPGDTFTLSQEEQNRLFETLYISDPATFSEFMNTIPVGFMAPLNIKGKMEEFQKNTKGTVLSDSDKKVIAAAASYFFGGTASFNKDGLLEITKEEVKTQKTSKKDDKRYRDEFELYNKENEIIEKNNHLLEISEKQRAGLYGQEYLDNLKEELTLLQNNNTALLNRQNLMKAQLNSSINALRGGGIEVDANRNVVNRQAQEQAALDAYNASQASTSESTREAGKIAYEKFKQLLKDYDEDLQNLRDTELEILEIKQKEAELALEKIEYYYDLIEQRLKNAKSLLELEKTIYENTQGSKEKDPLFIFRNLIDSAELDYEQVSAGYNQLKELQESPYLYDENGNMTEWGKKALQEAFDNGMDYISAIYEAKTAIYEEFTNVLEDQLSSMDENIDEIETYINIASGWQEVLEKSNLKVIRTYKQTGKEAQATAGAIDQLNNNIQKNIIESNTKQLQAQKAEYQAVLATQRLLKAEREKAVLAGDEELTAFYDEQLKTVNKSANEYLQNIQSLLQSTMDAITESFKSQIDQIMADFESSLSDYQDLDTLQERYDQFNQKQDRYLSSLEKEYELNKLNREIESKINSDNTSLLAKSKLLKIQEQINELQSSGNKMSEYDLKVLQQQYDLELARIALEEAQNAKNNMRLVRGENGQWRYAFTSDEQAINDAEQKVEDAEHALAKTNEEQLEKIQGDIIKTEKEASDAIAQIYQDLADGKYETYEDFLEDLTSTTEFYQKEVDYLYKELDKVLDNADISFKETFLGMNTDYKNTSEASKAWKEDTNKAVEESQKAWEEYQKQMSEITTDVTGDGDTLEKEITDNLGEIESGVETLASTTQTEAKNFTTSMGEMANSVSAFAKVWREEYLPIINTYGKEIEDTGSLIENESDVNAQEKAKQSMQQRSREWWFSNETGQSSLEAKNYEEGTKAGFTLDKSTGIWYYDADKTQQVYKIDAPSREEVMELYMQGSIGIREIKNYLNNTGHYLDEIFLEDLLKNGKISQKAIDELKKYGLILQFDTGGYTGSWGNKDGRLAMLHEKELVLNKSDTKNILDAVSLVRQISESIRDSVFANAGAALGYLGRVSNVRFDEQPHEIQQNVHIEASFPGIKDARELENALNNLVNDAVQYTGLR